MLKLLFMIQTGTFRGGGGGESLGGSNSGLLESFNFQKIIMLETSQGGGNSYRHTVLSADTGSNRI